MDRHQAIIRIMIDLQSRFLMNIPDDVAGSMNRIMVEVQKAYWMYCDNKKLSSIGGQMDLATFATHFFKSSTVLKSYVSKVKTIVSSFNQYLRTVPVYGCLIMDSAMTHVLMVKQMAVWLFPRGKRDEGEGEVDSAIREVREEVKLDVSSLISPMEYIEAIFNGKSIRLYIVVGADLSYTPSTLLSTEIHQCKWVPVQDMPSNTQVSCFMRLLYAWAMKRAQSPAENDAAHAHVRVPTPSGPLPLWRAYLEHCPRLADRLRPRVSKMPPATVPDDLDSPSGWSTRDMFHANETLLDRERLAASAARTTVLDFCEPAGIAKQLPQQQQHVQPPVARDRRSSPRPASRPASRHTAVPQVNLPPPPASAAAIRRPPPLDSLLDPPHPASPRAAPASTPASPPDSTPIPLDMMFRHPSRAAPAPLPASGIPVSVTDLMAHARAQTQSQTHSHATGPQPAVPAPTDAAIPKIESPQLQPAPPLASPMRPPPHNAKLSRVKALLRTNK